MIKMSMNKENKIDIIKNFLAYAVLLAATLIIVFNNLVISPQYEMVYSQYNQSIFYLIGKLMKSGKTLYVDMIDHKGVYIFLLHYLAEVICETKHFGLYLIGSTFIFVTALYIYKLQMLLSSKSAKSANFNRVIAVLLSIFSIILQTLYSISYGSLQCETFVSTALVISVYHFCKSIINDEFNYKTTLLYGIMFSFIVFIKANYALAFLFFAIYILIRNLNDKRNDAIVKHLIYGIFGVVIGMLPGIIYCAHKGIIAEMIHNTFVMNMLYSNKPYFGLSSRFSSITYTLGAFKIYFAVIILAFIVMLKIDRSISAENKKCLKGIFITTLILMFSLLYSARDYEYYLIVLIPSLIVILGWIFNIIGEMIFKCHNKVLKLILCLLCALAIVVPSATINYNFGKRLMVKNGEAQLKIAKRIKSAYDKDKSFAINAQNGVYDFFVLGTNLYLYDYMGMLPNFAYFCIPIIEYKHYSEAYTKTFEYINSGRAKYVVVGNGRTLTELFKNTIIERVLNENYSSISFSNGISSLVRKN